MKGTTPMYSPKIKASLVKRLYCLKVKTGKTMTRLVNEMLEKAIALMESSVYSSDPPNQ